jgi:hypothetical protein
VEPSFGERTGVLVVRIWIEAPFSPGESLRARITFRHDLDTGKTDTAAAASVDQVVEIVRAWLERFVAGEPEQVTDA